MSGFRRRALAALRLALAVVATVALLAAASRVVMPKNNQGEFGQADPEAHGYLGEPEDTVDVLFLGDSEAYSSFSPLQLWAERGITSYVAATSGQRLCYTRTLLLDALGRQSPQVVVLETNCLFTEMTPVDAAKRALQDLLPVFEYHDRWKRLRLEDLFAERRATWTDDLKGYRMDERVVPVDPAGHMAPSDDVARPAPLQRAYLDDIAAICARNGARLVLVSTPSTVNWNAARHNGVAREAGRLGVDYVDLNAGEYAVDVDWSRETRDAGDHLNHRGARKVTSAVGRLLAETYGVSDRRGEPVAVAWDEAHARYERSEADLVWPDEL